MIWGYPHFRKSPYQYTNSENNMLQCSSRLGNQTEPALDLFEVELLWTSNIFWTGGHRIQIHYWSFAVLSLLPCSFLVSLSAIFQSPAAQFPRQSRFGTLQKPSDFTAGRPGRIMTWSVCRTAAYWLWTGANGVNCHKLPTRLFDSICTARGLDRCSTCPEPFGVQKKKKKWPWHLL